MRDFLSTLTLSDLATGFNALAAALVILGYFMKGMIRLRVMAATSNVFNFLTSVLTLSPIGLIEYGISTPINLIRMREMIRLVDRVKLASSSDLSMDWLKPFMRHRHARAGEVIFARGDTADRMYMVGTGRFRLIETGIEIPSGQVVGELGLLTDGNRRTQGFECVEAGELFEISYHHVRELYYQNPEFGFYFLGLTSRRLLANIARLEAELERRPPAPAIVEPSSATPAPVG